MITLSNENSKDNDTLSNEYGIIKILCQLNYNLAVTEEIKKLYAWNNLPKCIHLRSRKKIPNGIIYVQQKKNTGLCNRKMEHSIAQQIKKEVTQNSPKKLHKTSFCNQIA